MKPITSYIGLDVHKSTISVAIAEDGRRGEVRHYGVVENRVDVMIKLAARLGRRGERLHFCYEAGPCGYGLHRLLSGLGHDCTVVAPSLIPQKPGDRVKTNRRDAAMLARMHRAGELTEVWVPDTAHEAMRDLVRARATAARTLAKARQHLGGFLLRHGKIYAGPRAWTVAYRRWLTTVRFDHPAQQIVLQDYIYAVEDAEKRIARLVEQIEQLLPHWSMAGVVKAIQAMRGVAFINAVTIVAEIGDFTRFSNPRQLMAYVGLVPSEHSSGDSVRRGGITKAGNGQARRALIEGAWTYRMQARVSRKLYDRLEELPQGIRDTAWKAQVRLCARYRRLVQAGNRAVRNADKRLLPCPTGFDEQCCLIALPLPFLPDRDRVLTQGTPESIVQPHFILPEGGLVLCQRQAEGRRYSCNRTRDDRVYLGDRPSGAVAGCVGQH